MSDPAGGGIDLDEFEQLLRRRAPELEASADPDAISMVFLLARLASQLLGDLDTRVHRPQGWSWSGFRILQAVLVCGPLEPRQIAPLAGVTRASISAVLNTLERDGLVERLRDSADRRLVTIALTEQGRKMLLETLPDQHAVEREWAAALSPAQQRTMIELMRTLLASPAGE
ncbi:MAG: MarR family transcriptional regulator [Actinobacteria bacterium]|nr:MarR family transcriptional regulator [Actinomycetota bacterium]